MNIFYLDNDPKECAKMHCDKHVVKMCVEYAQLLSTAHRILDGEEYEDKSKNGRKIKRWRLEEHDDDIYKACHVNHPSAVWARNNLGNYIWLFMLWDELCKEYKHRYGKKHLCNEKLGGILSLPPYNISPGGSGYREAFFAPPPAMKKYPQCIVKGDTIASYKNYYCEVKYSFAKWTKRDTPNWFTAGLKRRKLS